MSLPPERIHLKRRRQDDPVQALVLEESNGKRRSTGFLFRRAPLEDTTDAFQQSRDIGNASSVWQEKQHSVSLNENSEVPQVRTTLPGDEIKETKAWRAAVESHRRDRVGSFEKVTSATTSTIRVPINARRFHLSKEHSVSTLAKQHGGIRKPTHRPKGYLATFIEKGMALTDYNTQIHSNAPVIHHNVDVNQVESPNKSVANATQPAAAQTQVIKKHDLDRDFVETSTSSAKQGHTINTHPDTWDFDSEQLASELAEFALELDPEAGNEVAGLRSKSNLGAAKPRIAMKDDIVYETYIRVPYNADIQTEMEQVNLEGNIGVLVIAEDDEDLWEAYAESDSDDEWDEEDADSNAEDNPGNDYPEDELNSDDEYGLGAYNHRRYASEDEEYDFERDE